jgi:hypothetical protein
VNARTARGLAAVTVAAAVGVLAGPPAVAVVGGLLLGLVLPGVALSAVLFRGRALTGVERSVLAPALSLAVLVVAGLVVYASGFALDRPAWTSATALVTLLALVAPAIPLPRGTAARVAAARAVEDEITVLAAAANLAVEDAARPIGEQRVRLTPGPEPDGDRVRVLLPPMVVPVVDVGRPGKLPLRRIARQLVPMVLVLAVLGGAGWLSVVSSRTSYDATVTALSATPPALADTAGNRTVVVTATGLVAAYGPYRMTVVEAGGVGTRTVPVPVPSGGTWTARLPVGRARTTLTLYRAGEAAAYRTLYIAAAE